MHIFRENTEDIYAGIEWEQGTPEAQKFYAFLRDEMGVTKVRFPETSSFGVKPVSKEVPSDWYVQPLIRIATRPAVSDTGTQGKYHEVYGRRFQALGIRSG